MPLLIYIIQQGRIARTLVLISGIIEFIIAAFAMTQLWGREIIQNWTWLEIGGNTFLEYGLWVNNYSLALLLVVSIVSLMVRIYSLNYLANDNRRSWFIVLVGFFTFAMYGLVLSSNLLGLFFFWEWVGLASYLMIGFWYKKAKAAEAARKAFLYNKLGDLGFILALGIFYFHFKSFNIPLVLENLNLDSNQISVWFSIGIMIAAFAKSAQLPFSNWLADAMEGPTPASALIHSATMVTAGIYVLIRCFPFLDALLLEACLYLGIITVLWAGITAIKQNDIKKILAFSTISQLGFMLIGIASGNFQAAFFHLITHAFFKSSLFLSAGALINKQTEYLHSIDSKEDPKDIRLMNGLWEKSPYLLVLIILGAFSLSALPFFSGFLSKEAIISGLAGHKIVFVFALLATFITALYCGRIIFHLLKRNASDKGSISVFEDLRLNSGYYIPISVLALLSLSFFYALNPFDFSSSWFYNGLALSSSSVKGSIIVLILSSGLSILGLFIAYLLIFKRNKDIGFGTVFDNAFYEGFYIDRLLTVSLSRLKVAGTGLAVSIETKVIDRIIQFFTYSFVFTAMIMRLFDTYIIDGMVKLVVGISGFIGETTRQFQGGKLRNYLFWMILFVLLGLILLF